MKKLFLVVEWIRNDFISFTRIFLITPIILVGTIGGYPQVGFGFVGFLLTVIAIDFTATMLSSEYFELVEKTRPVVA